MAQFRPLRQHRYDTLVSEYFTRAEAQVTSEFTFNLPYIKLMRRDRAELVRGVRKLDLSRREALLTLRSWVDTTYEINGWKDAYAMVRDYRERAILRGDYIPPLKKKRRPTDKGIVEAQKRRYKERRAGRKGGAVGAEYDSEGKLIGEVYFNQDTGEYETR